MIRRLCSIFLLVFALNAYVQAQTPAASRNQSRNKVFRVEVNLVQVDAVVTDSKGQPVSGLTADDFAVYQDGKEQEITSFSMVRMETNPVPQPREYKSSQPSESLLASTPLPSSLKIRREQIRRTIALVVDDLGISFDGIVRTKEALRKWVDTRMQPGDLVAVILTGSGVGSLQQFTTDKRILHAAIDRITYNLSGRVGVSSFDPISDMDWGLTGYAADDHDMILTEGTVGAIQFVLSGLKDVPGRKSLILFSEDMRVFLGGEGRDIFMRSPLQRLIDEANRSAVVIHAIDPRGVVYTGPTAEDNMSSLEQEDIAGIYEDRTTELLSSQDGMVQLTELTGGLFEHSRNDIDTALTEVVNDGEVYYLIGYQPDADTAARMQQGYRRFHTIKVKVKRKGLQVRSRSGFFGTTDSVEEPPTRRERIERALVSPFASGNLPVRLTALFSQTKDKKSCLNALLHFNTNQLVFTDEEGWKKAVIDVVVTTFNAKGEQVNLSNRTWSIMAKGETFKEMQRYGVVFLMRFPVKQAGPYQMRAVVSDTASFELGSASQFIEIPDIGKGRLALSGIALAAEAKEVEVIKDQQEGMVAASDINGTVAVRVFEPGDTIQWAYQIINAKTSKEEKSQLEARVRLFHGGENVYAADPEIVSVDVNEDSGRLIGKGAMQLRKVKSGDYSLQVVILDRLAKTNQQVAAQSIDFSVHGSE
ncbi:MAG: VWA domain-containing protein [Acidobacteriota bacterium]